MLFIINFDWGKILSLIEYIIYYSVHHLVNYHYNRSKEEWVSLLTVAGVDTVHVREEHRALALC